MTLSFLHRYDPRCKLALTAAFCLFFFLPQPPWLLAAGLLLVALAVLLSLGFRQLLRPLRTIAALLALILLLTPPFHPGGAVYLKLGRAVLLSSQGLLEAVRLALRFTGLTLVFYALVRTTDPEDLILALRAYGLPFSAGMVIGVALQYIPGLKALYAQVQDAHRLRLAQGAGERTSGWRGLRRLLPLLTSVLILSVRRIPGRAMALELRGGGRGGKRTSLRRLPGGAPLARDWAITALVTALLAASVLLFHL